MRSSGKVQRAIGLYLIETMFNANGHMPVFRIGALAAIVASIAMPSLASCPAANQFSYLFNAQATTSLAYGTTYTYTATNGLGQTMNFTVSSSRTA